jgi:hypothetical protein
MQKCCRLKVREQVQNVRQVKYMGSGYINILKQACHAIKSDNKTVANVLQLKPPGNLPQLLTCT